MNSICLVIDRLQAGFLGPYGNTWIHTPQWNRLASESFVFDQALADSPSLDAIYQAQWHALPAALGQRSVHTALLTDDAAVEQHPLAAAFGERVLLPSADVAEPAETLEQTQLATLFAAGIAKLPELPEPYCLWLHSRGMAGPWDAPYELRAQYADEDDPAPPQFTAAPNRWLSEDHDPDELLGVIHAYAGQVSLLDSCLGAFLDAFRDSPQAERTLLAVLGARGFPLGEHRRVGPCDEPLYNETIHVPLVLRFPDGLGAMDRSQALVEGSDLHATLTEWWDLTADLRAVNSRSLMPVIRGEQSALRDHIVLHSRQDRAIRTPAWHFRQPLQVDAPAELYAKPSDRWEANEVANLLPEVTAAFRELLIPLAEQPAGNPMPLPEILVTEVE